MLRKTLIICLKSQLMWLLKERVLPRCWKPSPPRRRFSLNYEISKSSPINELIVYWLRWLKWWTMTIKQFLLANCCLFYNVDVFTCLQSLKVTLGGRRRPKPLDYISEQAKRPWTEQSEFVIAWVGTYYSMYCLALIEVVVVELSSCRHKHDRASDRLFSFSVRC